MMHKLNKTVKSITVVLFLLLSITAYSQITQQINYQGMARKPDGNAIAGKTIGIKFELLQGSATSSAVITETQSVLTSTLGLFTTQIGKNANLNTVNWQGGSLFLRVSIDTANGSNYVDMGVQQLVSVPFAIHAQSVPSSYTNNILTIGQKTYTLTQGVGTGITTSGILTSSVSGNSYTLDAPPTNISGAGSASVTGSFPNFTISTPSSQTYTNGAGIAITSGSIINIAPNQTVSIVQGSNVTVSGAYPNYTISAPGSQTYTNGSGITITSGSIINTAPNQTVNLSAGSNMSVSGTYPNYTVVNTSPNQTVSITQGSNVTVNGVYPNYTINAANSQTYTNGAGITITSGSIINTAPNQTVNLSAGSNMSVSGTYPNYTVANTSPNQTVSIAQGSNVTVNGTYPNYTINAANSQTYTNGSGISITSGSIINTAPNQTVNLSAGSNMSVSGTYPNYTVVNTSPNQTVSIAQGSNVTVSGTYPNYTINAVNSQTYTNGSGISISSGSIINTAPNQTVNLSAGSSISVGGTYPNYTVVNTAPNQTVNLLAGSNMSVSGAYPNYTVANTAPNQTVNIASGSNATISGSYPNYTVNAAAAIIPTITGAGIAAVSPTTGSNFTVSVPNPTLSFINNSITVNGGNSVAIAPTLSVSGNVLTVGPASNTVSLTQPTFAYSQITGSLTSGTNSAYITPSLSLSGNTLTSGPSSNSVNLSSIGPWAQNNGTVALNTTTSYVGVGTSSPQSLLDVDAQSGTASGLNIRNAKDIVGGAIPFNIITTTSGQTYGSNTFGRMARFHNATQNQIYDLGISSTGNLFLTNSNNYTNPYLSMTSAGSMGFGIASPSVRFHVYNPGGDAIIRAETPSAGTDTRIEFVKSASSSSAGVGYYSGSSDLRVRTLTSNAIVFEPNGVERMRVDNTGNVGIGTTVPSVLFDVNGANTLTTSVARVINTNSANTNPGVEISTNSNLGSALAVYNNGNGFGGIFSTAGNAAALNASTSGFGYALEAYNNNASFGYAGLFIGGAVSSARSGGYSFVGRTSAHSAVFVVEENGRTGIGTVAPAEDIQIERTTSAAMSIISASNNVSSLYFGNPTLHFMGAVRYDNSNNSMNFWTNNTPNRLTISSSGNLGIGVTTANAPLQFVNTTANRKIVLFENANNDHQFYGFGINNSTLRYQVDLTSSDHVFYSGSSTSTSNELMRITGTGSVGIGTSGDPGANLEVAQTGTFGVRIYPSPIVRTVRGGNYSGQFNFGMGLGEMSFDISNNLFTTSTNEYYFGTSQNSNTFRAGTDNTKSLGTSAIRWTTVFASVGTINTSDSIEKRNIRNLNYGLSEVMKMRPVKFNWKWDEKNDDKVGLIAQEVRALVPEAVKGGEQLAPRFVKNEEGQMVPNPNYSDRLGIYYSDLIPVLIKAIQEQQGIIDTQKSTIELMDKRLKRLEEK